MESALVVVLAGHIASGKTAVAQILTEPESGRQLVTVSDILRTEAYRRGVDEATRHDLQELGQVMATETPQELAAMILDEIVSSRGAVVDGLRGVKVVFALRERARSRVFVAYINTPFAVREHRYQNRSRGGPSLTEADAHPVETAIEQMRPAADLVVDGRKPAQVVASLIEKMIRRESP